MSCSGCGFKDLGFGLWEFMAEGLQDVGLKGLGWVLRTPRSYDFVCCKVGDEQHAQCCMLQKAALSHCHR